MLVIIASILVGITFAAVLISLILGGVSMQKRKDSGETSNKWMQRRIFSQAAAVLALAFLLYAKNKAKGG